MSASTVIFCNSKIDTDFNVCDKNDSWTVLCWLRELRNQSKHEGFLGRYRTGPGPSMSCSVLYSVENSQLPENASKTTSPD
jgi:hypothetical protein